MVLSNKKLKQKFRSLLAESIATAESKNSHKDSLQAADVSGELQGIKEILSSKSRKKPKSPNPEKRRNKRPLGKNPKASEGSEETQKRNGDSAVKEEEKKTKKKQKKKKKKVKEEEEEENGEIEMGGESKKRKREDEGEQGLNEKKNKEKKKKKENKVKVKEGNNEKEGENIEKASEIVETERSEKTVEEPIKFNQR